MQQAFKITPLTGKLSGGFMLQTLKSPKRLHVTEITRFVSFWLFLMLRSLQGDIRCLDLSCPHWHTAGFHSQFHCWSFLWRSLSYCVHSWPLRQTEFIWLWPVADNRSRCLLWVWLVVEILLYLAYFLHNRVLINPWGLQLVTAVGFPLIGQLFDKIKI